MLLTHSLSAWGSAEFPLVLKRELEQLGTAALPLQQALALSSYVADEPYEAVILDVAETASSIHARVGIFYSGIIAGCSCADDPTPVETQREHCVLLVAIDRQSAATTITLAAE